MAQTSTLGNIKLPIKNGGLVSALETLTNLKIVKESTGKPRDRLFAYPRYLHILSEGTEPLANQGQFEKS